MAIQNSKKKILVIQGNPDSSSFCDALAESYKKGALRTNADIKEIHVREIDFDPLLPVGYKREVKLEQGQYLNKIRNALKFQEKQSDVRLITGFAKGRYFHRLARYPRNHQGENAVCFTLF